ncbi:MAG: TetR/AcrR family transcriptional regulator [Xenococcaceae cyanobacterium MO_167.B27]|nr:TetR/AcrR family transcriptional regulator [Xenococcaceae cyanobacterium MO_167.B27]
MTRKTRELSGRPREFDRDAALAKAMDVFWEQGFSRTTYAALEKATGLHRQSLVYAFGDKKALFHAVLQHYEITRVQSVLNQLRASGSPLANIKAVLDLWLNDARRETTSGCLFVNISGELGQTEPVFAKLIEQSTQQLVQAFERIIELGQMRGEIISHVNATDLARQAIAVGDGALLRSRVSGDPSFAESAFQAFLSSIKR